MFSITTLGERIRQLRKEKKMTQEDLAGGKLSKGMLSLIENNKAHPSMESLTHIAERLGVSLADLLQEGNKLELKGLLEKIEKLYLDDNDITDVDEVFHNYRKIADLIRPVVDELTRSYESARLLELFSKSLFYSNQEGWELPLTRAEEIYENLHVVTRRAAIGVFRSFTKFSERDYHRALQILLEEKAYFQKKEVYLDPLTRLEFDYAEVTYLLAIGEVQEALEVLEEAIDFSRRYKIFYRIDDLFRLAVGYGILFHDDKMLSYYNQKLEHYGKLADDSFYEVFTDLALAEKKMFKEGNYKEALKLIEKHKSEGRLFLSIPHLIVAKGKVHYGLGEYEKAFKLLQQVKIPNYLHHPYDLALLYIADTYKGLCQYHLGNIEQALYFITLAKENFSTIPRTLYTDFTEETYRKIVDALKRK